MNSSSSHDYHILTKEEKESTRSVADIKNDIHKLNQLIKRTDYKINLYKRKKKHLLLNSERTQSLVQKGLSLFKFKKHLSTGA